MKRKHAPAHTSIIRTSQIITCGKIFPGPGHSVIPVLLLTCCFISSALDALFDREPPGRFIGAGYKRVSLNQELSFVGRVCDSSLVGRTWLGLRARPPQPPLLSCPLCQVTRLLFAASGPLALYPTHRLRTQPPYTVRASPLQHSHYLSMSDFFNPTVCAHPDAKASSAPARPAIRHSRATHSFVRPPSPR